MELQLNNIRQPKGPVVKNLVSIIDYFNNHRNLINTSTTTNIVNIDLCSGRPLHTEGILCKDSTDEIWNKDIDLSSYSAGNNSIQFSTEYANNYPSMKSFYQSPLYIYGVFLHEVGHAIHYELFNTSKKLIFNDSEKAFSINQNAEWRSDKNPNRFILENFADLYSCVALLHLSTTIKSNKIEVIDYMHHLIPIRDKQNYNNEHNLLHLLKDIENGINFDNIEEIIKYIGKNTLLHL